jgi:hypothetical protein
VREEAVGRFADEELLLRIARRDPEKRVRHRAFVALASKPERMAELPLDAPQHDLRVDAVL